MSKNNPANRNLTGHLKAGAQNIKTSYKAMYEKTGGVGGPAANLKAIVQGQTGKGMPKIPAGTRVKAAAMGAASVTPLGPVAAFASGVAKSVKAKADARAAAATPKAPQKEIKLAIRKPAAAPARPATPAPASKPGSAKPAAPKVGVKPAAAPRPGAPVIGKRP